MGRRAAPSGPPGATTKGEGAKARIRAAADTLFAERGLAGVSAQDLATAAGVTKAAVFYYYDGMAALHAEVLDGYYRAHEEALRGALDRPGTLAERLHGTLDAYLDFISANTRYARMVQRQVAGASEGADLEVVRRNLAGLLRAVEAALGPAAPSEGPMAPRHLFVTLSGAVINYFTYAPVLEAAWGRDPRSAAAVAERRAHLPWVVDALLAALGAQAGGGSVGGVEGVEPASSARTARRYK